VRAVRDAVARWRAGAALVDAEPVVSGEPVPLRLGDVILGQDVDTGARRTGVVVEVILTEGGRPRYRVENRQGRRWIVFWVGA